MQKRPIPIWEIILVTGIILLAGILRTAWPGITEFKADEARLLTLAYEMAEFKTFPIRGISSSVGLPNFPASVWVYALPLFVWKHIYSATIFTGLLNTGAVALCYFFTRRYVGRTAAIVATLMFAVSPWAVIHSRKIWAQNLLPIFVMIWAFSAALTFVDGKKRWIILHIAAGVFAFQIHLAAVSLLLGSALMLIIFRKQLSKGSLLAGINVALLTLAPFLFYIFARSSGGLSGLMGGGSGRSIVFSLSPFAHVARLTTGWQFHALAGPEQFENFLTTIPSLNWLFLVWGLICLAGLTQLIVDYFLSIADSTATTPTCQLQPAICVILLIWTIVPVITFLWFPVQVELHYLLPIYPVLYISAGIAVEFLVEGNWQKVFLAGLGVTAGLQVIGVVGLVSFIGVIDTPGGFGDTVAMQLANANRIERWFEATEAKEVLIVTDGADPLIDSQAAIFDLHLRHLPRRFVDGEHTAVFPAENSIVYISDAKLSAAENYIGYSGNLAGVVNRGSTQGLIMTLEGDVFPSSDNITFDSGYLLANFVNVQGIHGPDEKGTFSLVWQTGEAFQPDYHLTGQLFTAGEERIGQADIPAFAPDQWRPGDQVLSLFEPELSGPIADAKQLLIGMYVYPSGEPVPVLDAAANPAGDFIELELNQPSR